MMEKSLSENNQDLATSSMENVYIFCADLLGFKNIIKNLSPDDASERVKVWTDLVKSLASDCQITRYQFFSDTIVAKGTLQNLIRFSQQLLSEGVKESLLVRGAISHGKFSWPEGGILYGNALLEAYELQESQDWIGISVLISPETPDPNLVTYLCPLKKEKTLMLCSAVKWDVPSFKELTEFMTKKGLTKSGEYLTHDFMNKAANTALFGWYLRTVQQFPYIDTSKFDGFHPIQFMEATVKETLKTAERNKALAMAKACFANGLDIQMIATLTGLTEEELQTLID